MTTPTPDAKTVADKLTSVMFVEGYVGKENLEAVNFLLTQTLTDLQANAYKEGEKSVLANTTLGWEVNIPRIDGSICKWRLVEVTPNTPD